MQITKVISFLLILLLSIANSKCVNAGEISPTTSTRLAFNLVAFNEQIFTDPWLTYQEFFSNQQQFDSLDGEQKLWWLVRKAQCENLLYFYDELEQTISQLTLNVNEQTPAKIQGHLAYFQGLLKQRSGDYQGARPYYNQAMQSAKQQAQHYLYVQAKLELAYTHSLAELFNTSLADMQEVYVEAYALNDNFLIAIINETYGAIYGYMGENEKSLEYYQKALQTYEQLGYKAHIAEAIFGIASTYRYWKKYDLAVEHFRLYREKITFTPNSQISYFSAYGLGMTLAEQGHCTEALQEIAQAFALKGLDDYDAELYKRQASCLIQLKRLNEAEQALSQAKQLFNDLPALLGTAWHLEVDKIAAELAYAQSNYQMSFELLASYYQRYTDLLLANSTVRVSTIRASMEMERQEVEKALSKQRGKTEAFAVKAQEQETMQQQYFIIFLSILLLVILAVVIYQHQTKRKIFELSIIDPLSELYNRRYVCHYLDKQIQRTCAERGELSIIVFDIDDFKQINDNYGRPTGDTIIKQVGKIALETLRSEDVIGRLDGEEFLCVLPRTNVERCEAIAERMRISIVNHQFYTEQGHQISITASFGVAKYSQDLQDAKLFYSTADKALYCAKAQGKNCVITYRDLA